MKRSRKNHSVCCLVVLLLASVTLAQPNNQRRDTPTQEEPTAENAPSTLPPRETSTNIGVENTAIALVRNKEVLLGETFDVFVTVTVAPGSQIGVVEPAPLGADVEESKRYVETVVKAGKSSSTYRLVAQAFTLGKIEIPAIPITIASTNGSEVITTKPLLIEVRGTLSDIAETDVRPAAPPVAVEVTHWKLVYGMGAGVAVVVFFVVAWAIRRWLKRAARVEQTTRDTVLPADGPLAHEAALRRLDALERGGLVDADDRKPAFLELSEIMRAYIGSRFHFSALDFTTAEIHAYLKTIGDEGVEASHLIDGWLETCDLVKFANVPSSPDEARQALYQARRFVDQLQQHMPVQGKSGVA